VRKEAIPQWAEGLYYDKGLFSEVLVYYDDEALLFREQGQGQRRGALHLRDARDPDGGDRRGIGGRGTRRFANFGVSTPSTPFGE
jgi:hypothetical protein